MDFGCAALSEACAEHSGCVHAPCGGAVGRDGDDAAVAVDGIEFVVDDVVGGLLEGETFEAD